MAIRVNNLVKTYGIQRAVDGLSFDVKSGEVVGFLGPNGAGKSTTMKILTCYLSPTSGEASVASHDIYEEDSQIKRKIGYLPESNPLYTDMYLMDYLNFCARLHGLSARDARVRTHEMVGICGLTEEKHKKIGTLSKGYRQRVGLAQAMIHDPEVLILDEPTSGLDPNQIVEIRKLITNLGKEKTVMLSSHILSEVEATCKRIIIVNKGRIVADGTSEDLQASRRNQEVLQVRFSTPIAKEKLLAYPEVSKAEAGDETKTAYRIEAATDTSAAKAVFECCKQADAYLLELHTEKKSLEDVFAELTR